MPDHIPSAEEAREALDKADAMVHALCHGERRWTMRVPARPDDDPDLVIGAGLYAARARLAALEAENERLRADAERWRALRDRGFLAEGRYNAMCFAAI